MCTAFDKSEIVSLVLEDLPVAASLEALASGLFEDSASGGFVTRTPQEHLL